MTAWGILVANSTAALSATAWDHLNNQSAGAGTVVGGMRSANITRKTSANIEIYLSANNAIQKLTTNKISTLSASIKQKTEASVCQ